MPGKAEDVISPRGEPIILLHLSKSFRNIYVYIPREALLSTSFSSGQQSCRASKLVEVSRISDHRALNPE